MNALMRGINNTLLTQKLYFLASMLLFTLTVAENIKIDKNLAKIAKKMNQRLRLFTQIEP